jgi:hypothetical protein
VNAHDFKKYNPDFCLGQFKVAQNEMVRVKEYAPRIFKEIRAPLCNDEMIYKSLAPAFNYKAIHNFKPGEGKSPCFFFFSDNDRLMIKTLKMSEFYILMEFLPDYY